MKVRVDTLLIKTQFLVLIGIVIMQVLNLPEVASALFMMTFFLTMAFWLMELERRINKTNLLAIGIMVVSFISVAVNAMVTDAVLSFSYVKKLIMFWSTVLFFAAMTEYKPDKSVLNLVFRTNTLLAVFLLIMYLTMPDEMHTFNEQVTIYLTFRFTNPNLTAAFLSSVCILQMVYTYATRKWYVKLLNTVLIVALIVLILDTKARTSWILMAVFLLAYAVVNLLPKIRWRMTKRLAWFIAWLPLLFALLYMELVNNARIQEIFSFLVNRGKLLDARVEIWTDALEAIKASPVIGAYNQISDGTGESQMHNSLLDIAASYGIPVMLILGNFLRRVLYTGKDGPQGKRNFICIMGFSALLMSGIGEAMIFSGGLGIYLYAGILRMLANYDFEDRKVLK